VSNFALITLLRYTSNDEFQSDICRSPCKWSTNRLHEIQSFLKSWNSRDITRIFMETEILLQCSQETATLPVLSQSIPIQLKMSDNKEQFYSVYWKYECTILSLFPQSSFKVGTIAKICPKSKYECTVLYLFPRSSLELVPLLRSKYECTVLSLFLHSSCDLIPVLKLACIPEVAVRSCDVSLSINNFCCFARTSMWRHHLFTRKSKNTTSRNLRSRSRIVKEMIKARMWHLFDFLSPVKLSE
jgi:hypothetical protein